MGLFNLFSKKNSARRDTAAYFYGLLTENFPGYTVHRDVSAASFVHFPSPAASGSWKCGCGSQNTGKFCPNCGTPRPESKEWTCSCGAHNTGNFCPECGRRKQTNPSVPTGQNFEKATFLLRRNDRVEAAILLVPKYDWDTAAIRSTMDACRASGIPCLRFMKEFQNNPDYVVNRIRSVLR